MYLDTKREGEVQVPAIHPMAAVFLKAADAIERFGHCKHALARPGIGMCVVGAINYATTGDPRNYAGNVVAYGHVFKKVNDIPYHWQLAHDFNDAPETTKEMVVAGLRKAARWVSNGCRP